MNTEQLVKTIVHLPKNSKKALFRRLAWEIEEMAEEHVFPFKIKHSKHKEPNAETRKVLEESNHWSELRRRVKNAKSEEERKVRQKELVNFEKQIGIVYCESLDDFCKKFRIPTKKHKTGDA